MNYGILTLLPAVIVIVTAIVSKRTTESLLLGVLISYIIVAAHGGGNLLTLLTDGFFATVTDYDTMWVVIVCGLFGSLIALIDAAKGTQAISSLIGKICRDAKSTLLVSWLLGIVIFIDDYLNIITVSACTRELSDKRKVPREALAYVIDSTGAPVCVLLPLSTWAVFFGDIFYEQECVQNLGYGSATNTYLHIIPFAFYAILALFMVPLFIYGLVPKIGSMKKAYQRVQATGMVYSERSINLNRVNNIKKNEEELIENWTESKNKDREKANILDFILPIAVMVAAQLITDDMFVAVAASIIFCAVLYIPEKKLTGNQFCDLWVKGFADNLPALFIIVAAMYMRQASSALNLPEYVVSLVQPYVNAYTFPMISFIIVSMLAFVTGSNWGIPAICAPILLQLGSAVDASLILVMAAILSGGTFGSHACFYSDASVMTSNACCIDNMDHVYSQIPYAMIAFGLSCAAYVVSAFLM